MYNCIFLFFRLAKIGYCLKMLVFYFDATFSPLGMLFESSLYEKATLQHANAVKNILRAMLYTGATRRADQRNASTKI
jgi:hypothetical protein